MGFDREDSKGNHFDVKWPLRLRLGESRGLRTGGGGTSTEAKEISGSLIVGVVSPQPDSEQTSHFETLPEFRRASRKHQF